MKHFTDKDFKMNFKGHDFWVRELLSDIDFRFSIVDSLSEIKGGDTKKIKAMIGMPHPFKKTCQTCDEFVEIQLLPDMTLQANSECKYANGCPEIVVDLAVPSGEIVLFNDLREFYEEPKDNDSCNGINSFAGKLAYSEGYAKQGLIIHFVGNSCPSVNQVSSERLEIGRFNCKDEDGCTQPKCPMPSCKVVNKIGSICTDLWWYCAVDRVAFETRIGKTIEQYQKEYHDTGAWPDLIVAKVTPGTYRTTGRYDLLKEGDQEIFSVIERIGD